MKWTEDKIAFIQALYETHTYEEIAIKFNKKFKSKKTPNAIRKAHERYLLPVDDFSKSEAVKMPKVLCLDIETSPLIAYIWSLWQDRTPLNMVKDEWCVLSLCAKWVGEDEIFYADQRNAKDVEDDSKLLKMIWKLLDEADFVLTQNGVKFDIPKLNARFVMNGMQPPSSFRHIDTLKLAKKHFKFTSNKLEWLSGNLCIKNKKLKHSKYPGFELWKAVLQGDLEAWKEMEEYNVMDVKSLEELYFILAPWDSTINFSMYNDDLKPTCSCGSQEFKRSGFYYTNSSKFQKYRCNNCGREIRDKKNLLSKEKSKSMTIGTVR
jgi:hypothetical protein